MNQNVNNNKELLNKINIVRKLMVVTAQTKGYTNPETIKYSEELDKLILETQLLWYSNETAVNG
ncbi:aspartyl-phosphate phosphatase Spo0E family protein [Metabacillus malikii]|uniref:Aspartyl-phosphate phosphatase Spo0E family protein n=1 Tax=Metabacillus malikii TaxID=1504265 RepID=A0ABT9ZDK9_9BACI|nr:aspartyl-phosphate phosphatase Spo0E family protein [Metabacillus malikii]MDQ0230353.1 hypothetical protein [Metabacillus malikii]